MTALIIDDEPLSRQELTFLLEEAPDVEIVGQGANGIEAVELIRQHAPDLVFLDVQMPGLDGFAVLRKLRERGSPVPEIVFATAFDQYAVRAFDVNAVDYLLKPFERTRVLQTIEKARQRLSTREESPVPTIGPALASGPSTSSTEEKLDALLRLLGRQQASQLPQLPIAPGSASVTNGTGSFGRIVIRAQSRLLLVDQREVCFVAIEDGAIQVTTPTLQGLSTSKTLEELAELLDPEMFWRVHRSYLVNLQHIREVVPWFRSTYQLRMDDPARTEIPVARAQTKRLRELFNL